MLAALDILLALIKLSIVNSQLSPKISAITPAVLPTAFETMPEFVRLLATSFTGLLLVTLIEPITPATPPTLLPSTTRFVLPLFCIEPK